MDQNVLARVDGRPITQVDLYELIQSIGQNAAQFNGPDGQAKLVDELIMQELLYSDALKNNLQEDEEFKLALEHTTRSLLKQYAMSKLLRTVEATDDEIEDYFNAHKEAFLQPETATASHILVQTEEEAQKIAEEIKNGLDFKEAAKKYSSCPSSANGGSLGTFSKGQMVPEFEKVVFTMSPDEISEPVQTQFGYHLIKLENRKEASTPQFDAVKAQVKEQCLLAKRQELYLQKRQQLEKEYTVEKK